MYSFRGYTIGKPIDFLNAMAASVGILAINLIATYSLHFGSVRSIFTCSKADKAPTTPVKMAIGWALSLKPL